MKLYYKDNVFYLETKYEEYVEFKEEIKEKAKFRWDSFLKRWYTDNFEKAKLLINLLKDNENFEVNNEVFEKIKEKEREIEEKLNESKSVNADIDVPAPEGLEYYPFQKAGIKFAINRKNVLIADEMGLGKTIQAIGVINHYLNTENKKNIKILIVCPSSLKINWKRELKKWLIEKLRIEIINSKDIKNIDSVNILIINYDILDKKKDLLLKYNYDIVIADEVHYVKNPKAKRSKAFYEIVKNAEKKIYLSGTPLLNRPIELQPIAESLDFEPAKNFWYFVKRYCNAYKDKWGWNFKGASNLEELQKKLRLTIMIRREKNQVLKELPDKIRQVIEIPCNGLKEQINKEKEFIENLKEQIKKIKEIKEKAKKEENEEEYRKAIEKLNEVKRIGIAEISKLRHETALKKVPYLIEYVKEVLEQQKKIVIFAHHLDVIEEIYNAFKDIAVKLTGDMNINKRQEAIDKFQKDDNIRIFVGSIQASGVGITLTASSFVIFHELDWVPANMIQAEDRCHRIGQKDTVLVQYFVVDESIDSKLAKVLIEKQKVIDKVLKFEKLENKEKDNIKIDIEDILDLKGDNNNEE